MIVQRSKWLRGDLNGARFLDSDGNRDILGFYLKGKVDDVDLNDRIDILQAVYEGDISAEQVKELLELVSLDDPEYTGLHYRLNPLVDVITMINDCDLGTNVVHNGRTFVVSSEKTRESLLELLFNEFLQEEIIFED